MSDRVKNVFVELQIRTIAMDFWASLEHKIYYKYDKDVPVRIKRVRKDASFSVSELDVKMENISKELAIIKRKENGESELFSSFHSLHIAKPRLQLLLQDFLAENPKEKI